jgi:hypothetical protein
MQEYRIVCNAYGDTLWYKFGTDEFHREDGPAIEYANGTKHWYLNGKCHRIGGPAVIFADGTKFWHLNGKLHRTDGPAQEWASGGRSWFLNGKELTEEEFNQQKVIYGPVIALSDMFSCDCGADKCKTTHSTYCSKYKYLQSKGVE